MVSNVNVLRPVKPYDPFRCLSRNDICLRSGASLLRRESLKHKRTSPELYEPWKNNNSLSLCWLPEPNTRSVRSYSSTDPPFLALREHGNKPTA